VFIRSMANRGALGGLSEAALQTALLMDAAGRDLVLLETVGVGQAEVEIASLADTSVVLLAPGMGDAIQVAKAGILEIADIFVVNKADRDGADTTARDLRQMMSLGEKRGRDDWTPPILKTVASRHEGIEEVVEAIDRHHEWLVSSGGLDARRRVRAADEIESLALTTLRRQMGDLRDGSLLDELAGRVVAGVVDPYTAADELTAQITDR
jgi:LAO/AO transport system kinase